MKKSLILLLFVLAQLHSLTAQTVTGRIINQKEVGLPGLQTQLFIAPKVYTTNSGSGGIFSFEVVITTGVKNEQLPIGYDISENYPNPFNPSSRIDISVPKSGIVRVDIFNLLGQKVKGIGEQQLNAGLNYIDLEVSGLLEGQYIARITIDERYSVSRKMIFSNDGQGLPARGSISQITKSGSILKSATDTKIDSLVVTGSLISKKVFKNLPNLTGNFLDLGNLAVSELVTDIDGNVYNTVAIGTQLWLAENLKTTKYSDGTAIPLVTDNTIWANLLTPAYCWYNNDMTTNKATFGALYSWYAVNSGKLCPAGWHVPTDVDWSLLATYLGGESIAGNKLKESGTIYWQSPNANATNETGFSALPGGYRNYIGIFTNKGVNGYWWSSTELSNSKAYYRNMGYNYSNATRDNVDKFNGFSVRCISGELSVPILATAAITSITTSTAVSGGNITSDGGSTILERGICWGTSTKPTINDNNTVSGNGTGIFTSSLTGLMQGVTYYLRAYATNSSGTTYGNEISFFVPIQNVVPPILTTISVTNISSISATSGGNISSDGGSAISARGVCWSTTSTPTILNSKTTDGTGTGSYQSSIIGLSSNTTYYVRAYATNSMGTSYGSEISFTTTSVVTTITTTAVTAITSSSATSGGSISADGGLAITARGVCWNTSAGPTTSNTKTNDGTGAGNFISSLSSLSAGTTYYLRAYAINSAGTAYGNEVSFKTGANLPTVTTNMASSISATAATSGGNVASDGGATITARGVCWNTAAGPTIGNSKTSDGTGTGPFSSSITGLAANTTYFVRAYATNGAGTGYGNESSFITIGGTTGLLDGAQFFNGTVPAIGLVKYMNGTKLAADSAYSGQVLVFFHTPVIDKTATDLIVAKGGTVLGKVPNAGFYFVGVPSGGEGTFISSMKLNQAIHDALPHVVARYMSTGVSYIDGCKLSHGNQVNCVIQGALHEYASPNCRDDDDGDGKPMVKKTIENIYKTVSEANGGNAVINISSFGGFSNGTDYNQVDSTRKAEIISRARSYLYAILTPIAELPEYYRENLVITLCAGNDNTPLTEILDQIRTDVTLANVLKNNVLIVGANEAVFHGSNDAPNDPDFANMKSVYSCDMSIGTSFAAPLAAAYITNLINDLGITAKQALNAVKIAVMTNSNNEFIEEEAHSIANMIKSGNKEIGFYSGGSNLIMRSEAMQTCTQNFYLQTTLSVAWEGSMGFMIVPAHYWREVIGQCVLVGVIQDYKVIKEPITLINNVITGSANAMFLSGPGGSFPVTMKLTGTLNSNGAIVGTLAITSEILSQDFQVTLQKQ